MQTECTPALFEFPALEARHVVAAFDGGAITSDAGALLLGQTDRAIRLTERFAACFTDTRAAELVQHRVETIVMQRVVGIALGYEDLNDHDELRHDPVLAVLASKLEAQRSDCAPLAGKSTLNRLELSRVEPTRYHKISHDPAAIENLFVDLFLDAHKKAPKQIILDLDATDDPLHGNQEGKFFHGYYDCYCYLPLYIFCGRHLLVARLRRSNMDAAAGAIEEVARIVAQIRCRWPRTRILLRGDSGFTREPLMAWCEVNRVDYVFGLARNDRLEQALIPELISATLESIRTGRTARCFKDFSYATLSTWSCERRVIGKAEVTGGEANPRFIVTSLKRGEASARHLYEKIYCARGDMENRIKECQLDLFADRTSTATMQANQLRLWLASMAYVLLCALRRIGLAHTQFAEATCGTIRLRLLKIGALVRVSVRRIKIAMASACPWQDAFALAYARLRNAIV
jgi:Transposase DDE domain group 1